VSFQDKTSGDDLIDKVQGPSKWQKALPKLRV